MKQTLIISLAIIAFIGVTAYSAEPLKIALSKGSGGKSYENYKTWLESYAGNVEIVDIYVSDKPFELLSQCDGLVLTGGPDVNPGRFGQPNEANRCTIDEHRDTLEFELLQKAFEYKMPVLGICRGQQLINVALGGSLIIDIPTDKGNTVTHQLDSGDAHHYIYTNDSSRLKELSGVDSALVNSNHHQGIDRLANDLKATGKTADGLIEAYEWKDGSQKSWLMAVQWHPERLEKGDRMSEPIAESFLQAARIYKEKVDNR
jgi:putative glutamine amidotransferase